MIRLTVDPKTLSFKNEWNVYIHFGSISQTYNNSYLKIGTIKSVYDFWSFQQHMPSTNDLYHHWISLDGRKVVAYSIFKHSVTPEWEDYVNASGSEWGCRENLSDEQFNHMWFWLRLMLCNDQLPNVVGIRCINKSNRLRTIFKIELWMNSCNRHVTEKVKNILDDAFHGPEFTLMFHSDKQSQAFEYTKKKMKKSCDYRQKKK